VVEDIRLAPEVLEPDPVDIAGNVFLFLYLRMRESLPVKFSSVL
jgi:hypothetical protein